jgi:hypothetical protein
LSRKDGRTQGQAGATRFFVKLTVLVHVRDRKAVRDLVRSRNRRLLIDGEPIERPLATCKYCRRRLNGEGEQ